LASFSTIFTFNFSNTYKNRYSIFRIANEIISSESNHSYSSSIDPLSFKLEELGYTDLWKYAPTDDYDRFTWFYHDGTGFRLDYAFVSPHLSTILKEVSVFHDHELRKSKISDHSALVVKLEI
jgi:exonuclease III